MLVGGGEGSKEMYSKLQRSSTKIGHEAKGIFSATSCTGLWNEQVPGFLQVGRIGGQLYLIVP